jgi:hypothetical protein
MDPGPSFAPLSFLSSSSLEAGSPQSLEAPVLSSTEQQPSSFASKFDFGKEGAEASSFDSNPNEQPSLSKSILSEEQDQGVDMAGFKGMERSVLLVLISLGLDLLAVGLIVPLLPYYAKNCGIRPSLFGILTSIFGLYPFPS